MIEMKKRGNRWMSSFSCCLAKVGRSLRAADIRRLYLMTLFIGKTNAYCFPFVNKPLTPFHFVAFRAVHTHTPLTNITKGCIVWILQLDLNVRYYKICMLKK